MRSIGLQLFILFCLKEFGPDVSHKGHSFLWRHSLGVENKWILDGKCIESESKSDFGVWRFYIHLEAQLRKLYPIPSS